MPATFEKLQWENAVAGEDARKAQALAGRPMRKIAAA
jgi:hypothetical protein